MTRNPLRYFLWMLPVLLGSLACMHYVNKECGNHPILTELITQSKLPLDNFQNGILIFAFLISFATFGVLSPRRKKFALGIAFWAAVVSVFAICIGVNLVGGLESWQKKSLNFEPYINDAINGLKHSRQFNTSRMHFEIIQLVQEKYNCCGLQGHVEYLAPRMQLYIKIFGESGQLPKSCCLPHVEYCTESILQNEYNPSRKLRHGCSEHLLEITSPCKNTLGIVMVLMLFLSAAALIVTWAFLRHCQNLSFWEFGRVIKRKTKKAVAKQ